MHGPICAHGSRRRVSQQKRVLRIPWHEILAHELMAECVLELRHKNGLHHGDDAHSAARRRTASKVSPSRRTGRRHRRAATAFLTSASNDSPPDHDLTEVSTRYGVNIVDFRNAK